MKSELLGLVLILLLAAAGPARAHEGETHKDAAPPTLSGDEALTVLSATGDQFELVVKHTPLRPGEDEEFNVYVSDYATNAPITDAEVSMSLRDSDGGVAWEGEIDASSFPGIYRAEFAVPDTGVYNLITKIVSGKDENSFALSGIRVMYKAEEESDGGIVPAWGMWALVAVAGVGGLILGFLGGRSGRRHAVGVAGALLALVMATQVWADEGHDDAPPESAIAVQTGGVVTIPKESQFLLNVRTQVAVARAIPRRWRVLGRVAPEVGKKLELRAPQSGRVYPASSTFPALGQIVQGGQSLAVMVIVDSLELRTTLSGTVTEVNVAPGQLVETGQHILTVVDPSTVLVHADVFQVDLEKVSGSRRAWVEVPGDLGPPLEGTFVSVGLMSGEVAGTVEVLFRVPNPETRLRFGSLVNVDIDLGTVDNAVVVPRSAIVEREGRTFAFVHSSPEEFEVREVNVASIMGNEVAVDQGLDPRDRVVISGLYALMPGASAAYGGR